MRCNVDSPNSHSLLFPQHHNLAHAASLALHCTTIGHLTETPAISASQCGFLGRRGQAIASRASQHTVGIPLSLFLMFLSVTNGACTTDQELVPMRCQRIPAWHLYGLVLSEAGLQTLLFNIYYPISFAIPNSSNSPTRILCCNCRTITAIHTPVEAPTHYFATSHITREQSSLL